MFPFDVVDSLILEHSIPIIESIRDPRNLASAALIVGIIVLLYFSLFRRGMISKTLCMATVWLIFPFLPGLLPWLMTLLTFTWLNDRVSVSATGIFMKVGFVVAERLLYVPSVGFCFFAAMILDRWLNASESVTTVPDEPTADSTSPSSCEGEEEPPAPKQPRASLWKVIVVVLTIIVIGMYSLRFVHRKIWQFRVDLHSGSGRCDGTAIGGRSCLLRSLGIRFKWC